MNGKETAPANVRDRVNELAFCMCSEGEEKE